MNRVLLISLVSIAATALGAAADAAVVVMANRTSAAVSFVIVTPDGARQQYRVAPGDVLPIAVRDRVAIGYDNGEGVQRHLLAPNAVYYFFRKEQIDLVERRFATEDATPALPSGVDADRLDQVLEIPVMILADDDEPAVRRVWEARLRKRLDEASDIFEHHCRIRFKVAAVGTWESDNRVVDFRESLREFERKVKLAPPARLAIGFTSQYEVQPTGRAHLGGTRGPLHPYVLVREWSQHISGPERLEVLVHELGHVFGASHSAEADSVMRPVVGDRRAHARDFRIGFDPVNALALYVFCEELRLRGVRSTLGFSPATRELLCRIYDALGKELPNDDAAEKYVALLSGTVTVKPVPASRQGSPPSLPAAAALVVEAVTNAARRNHSLQEDTGNITKLSGDRLTEYYFRIAAMALKSREIPPKAAANAYVVGLAAALDDTTWLRNQAALGPIFRRFESDAQREKRLAVLGNPTMRGRRDLTRHFVVSAALAALVGSDAAEAVGVAKELADSGGRSGFSFVDLSADLSGVAFALRVLDGKLTMPDIAQGFAVNDYLPEPGNLPEGLAREVLTDRYGPPNDARFMAEKENIRRLILALPGHGGDASK